MGINFGILCDAGVLESWQLRSLNRLQTMADARAALWIDLSAPGVRIPRPAGLASLPTVTLMEPTAEGGGTVVSEPALERVKDQDLDFILSFLTAPCPSRLLGAARHGVWAYQFGDWTKYRGKSAAFWEFYEAEPVTAAMLVRLQHEADSVVVLREAYLRTDLLSYARTREQLLARITHWPAQLCLDMRNGILERLNVPAADQRGSGSRRTHARAAAQLQMPPCCPDGAGTTALAAPPRSMERGQHRSAHRLVSALRTSACAIVKWLTRRGAPSFVPIHSASGATGV